MTRKTPSDPLALLRTLCERLPEAACKPAGDHAAFEVRGKKFAYFLDNHHGDGIVGVAVRVLPGDNQRLAAAEPGRFCLPAYIASRGWVTLRLDRGPVDWNEVFELMAGSYCLAAPKKLAAIVTAELERTSP